MRSNVSGSFAFRIPQIIEETFSGDTIGDEATISTLRGMMYKLCHFHLSDWVAISDAILDKIKPFYHYVGETMIDYYMYPLKTNTISNAALPVGLLLSCRILFMSVLYVCMYAYYSMSNVYLV